MTIVLLVENSIVFSKIILNSKHFLYLCIQLLAQQWSQVNDTHTDLSTTCQRLLTDWTTYEQTSDQVQVSLGLLEHQNRLNSELVDSLEEKQARIHEQKSLCFSADELKPR